jgi:hypothetical protein
MGKFGVSEKVQDARARKADKTKGAAAAAAQKEVRRWGGL